MQAFKLYYKIILRGAIYSLLMYFTVFCVFAILFNSLNNPQDKMNFSLYKTPTAIINQDNTDFSKDLSEYIKKNSKYVDLKSEDEITDSLFFRETEVAIIIPEGFSKSFLKGGNAELTYRAVPDSTSSQFMTMMIDSYLNTFKFYSEGNPNLSYSDIQKNVLTDLGKKAEIKTMGKASVNNLSHSNYFFNFSGYAFLGMLIFGISMIMSTINKLEIRRRNNCSPKKSLSFSVELILGNLTLSLIVWALFLIISMILYPSEMLCMNGIMYALNSLCFILVAMSISFLTGNITNKTAITALTNVISLGGAFLGGCFVPQSLLSSSVLKFAVVNPVFWFVKANDIIGNTSEFTGSINSDIFSYMGIQLCFALAFIAISLVYTKYKKTSTT